MTTIKNLALATFLTLPLVGLWAQKRAAEVGMGTMYHDSFDGSKTCTNDKYDKSKLTAAHKSIPAGTMVRVTRLSNNKSVDVRINDCGPYTKGQIIELSRAAAEVLGMDKTGPDKVKVEVLDAAPATEVTARSAEPTPAPEPVATKPEPAPVTTPTPAPAEKPAVAAKPEPKPAPAEKPAVAAKPEKKVAETKAAPAAKPVPPAKSLKANPVEEASAMEPGGLYKVQALKIEPKGFGVQIAGYSDYEGVMQQINVLQKNWFKGNLVYVDELNGKPFYKVILGPFFTKEEAQSYVNSYRKKFPGSGAFVVNLEDLNKTATPTKP